MAIAFARARYVSRTDGGNAVRSATYNSRDRMECERTAEVFYFRHKSGLLHHEVMLPDGAPEQFRDASKLWNAAQAAEDKSTRRATAQEAREIVLALPADKEITLEDHRVMVREFCQEHFVKFGVPVQFDIHAPHEGEMNYHAHILIATRRLGPNGFDATKARDLDPDIRKGKVVDQDQRWGAIWRDRQNAYFERLGLSLRVDETSIVPQEHIGPVRFRGANCEAVDRNIERDDQTREALQDPASALKKLVEHDTRFKEPDVDRLLAKHFRDDAERAEIKASILSDASVVRLYDAECRFVGFTTLAVQAEERRGLDAVDRMMARRFTFGPRAIQAAIDTRTMRPDQLASFRRVMEGRGYSAIEGRAGVGKSYVSSAIRDAAEGSGYRVIGLAPTNKVARAQVAKDGFEEAHTAHRALMLLKNGKLDVNQRTVVILDEAAMLDNATSAELKAELEKRGAMLVEIGDDRQLPAVGRSGLFTESIKKAGSSVIDVVTRQKVEWQRDAATAFSNFDFATGLKSLDDHGAIVWSDTSAEAMDRLIADVDRDGLTDERPAFIFAYTNEDVNRGNEGRRASLKAAGKLEGVDHVFATRHGNAAFAVNDRIQFTDTRAKDGLINGEAGTITQIDGTAITAKLDSGQSVTWDATEFNGFRHGYAGTVYKGQGDTIPRVYLYYSQHWRAESAYVALSRQEWEIKVYAGRDVAPDLDALATQMGRRINKQAAAAFRAEADLSPEDLAKARAHAAAGEALAGYRQVARVASGTWTTIAVESEAAGIRPQDHPAYAGYAAEAATRDEHAAALLAGHDRALLADHGAKLDILDQQVAAHSARGAVAAWAAMEGPEKGIAAADIVEALAAEKVARAAGEGARSPMTAAVADAGASWRDLRQSGAEEIERRVMASLSPADQDARRVLREYQAANRATGAAWAAAKPPAQDDAAPQPAPPSPDEPAQRAAWMPIEAEIAAMGAGKRRDAIAHMIAARPEHFAAQAEVLKVDLEKVAAQALAHQARLDVARHRLFDQTGQVISRDQLAAELVARKQTERDAGGKKPTVAAVRESGANWLDLHRQAGAHAERELLRSLSPEDRQARQTVRQYKDACRDVGATFKPLEGLKGKEFAEHPAYQAFAAARANRDRLAAVMAGDERHAAHFVDLRVDGDKAQEHAMAGDIHHRLHQVWHGKDEASREAAAASLVASMDVEKATEGRRPTCRALIEAGVSIRTLRQQAERHQDRVIDASLTLEQRAEREADKQRGRIVADYAEARATAGKVYRDISGGDFSEAGRRRAKNDPRYEAEYLPAREKRDGLAIQIDAAKAQFQPHLDRARIDDAKLAADVEAAKTGQRQNTVETAAQKYATGWQETEVQAARIKAAAAVAGTQAHRMPEYQEWQKRREALTYQGKLVMKMAQGEQAMLKQGISRTDLDQRAKAVELTRQLAEKGRQASPEDAAKAQALRDQAARLRAQREKAELDRLCRSADPVERAMALSEALAAAKRDGNAQVEQDLRKAWQSTAAELKQGDGIKELEKRSPEVAADVMNTRSIGRKI